MKPELTQKELEKFVRDGKTMIWQYRTLYQIEWCHAMGERGEYILRPTQFRPYTTDQGVTVRGRFMAMTPERAYSFITA